MKKSKVGMTVNEKMLFESIKDQINKMLEVSGAVAIDKAISIPDGMGEASESELMACIDLMIKSGELHEIKMSDKTQNRIFVK